MLQSHALFSELGVPFADSSTRVQSSRASSPEETVIPGDNHPNEAGAKLIAKHLYPFLRSELRSTVAAKRLAESSR